MNKNDNDGASDTDNPVIDEPDQAGLSSQRKDGLPALREKDITRRERAVVDDKAAVRRREKLVLRREDAVELREQAAGSRQDTVNWREIPAASERILLEIETGQAASEDRLVMMRQANSQLIVSGIEAGRASQLKDEFLALVSHELRTPLNAILGWSQLILGGKMGQEDIHKGMQIIERSARAQNKLIEDILEISSMIAGKVRLDMQQLDIASLVSATVQSVKPMAETKGIILQETIDRGAGWISGDVNRLQQVFWNLLSNAIKFTSPSGRIDIVMKQSGSFLEIRINDSGLGISADFLPYVFDRFRQAETSLSRQHGGLGLGLALVKQLVELHGGTVRAESAGLNKGASFIVQLSLAAASDEKTQEKLSSVHSSFDGEKFSLSGITVLVVDDDLDGCELVKQMLSHCQVSVITSASAMEGLQLLKMESPDVLISDIEMPGKNGYQFVREVRELPAENGGKTPAIALTACARPEDKISAMNAGFQEYLTKPVEASALVATIRSLVGQHRKSS
ncbi:MAG: response regulator [Nitrosospira sp.]|nr:response regulator [Nitrosospira sp.]